MKRILINLSLLSIIALSAFSTYWALNHHLRVVHILSDSMAPSIKRGDLMLVSTKPTSKLRVGDIAILPSVKDEGVFYSHRIVEMKWDENGTIAVKTKGDANHIPDDSFIEIRSQLTPISLLSLPVSKLNAIAPDGKTLALLISLPILYRFYLVRKYRRKEEFYV